MLQSVAQGTGCLGRARLGVLSNRKFNLQLGVLDGRHRVVQVVTNWECKWPSAGDAGGVADSMMFDRVVELEVVMGGHWPCAKTRVLWGIKFRGVFSDFRKKNTGYDMGGQSRILKLG